LSYLVLEGKAMDVSGGRYAEMGAGLALLFLCLVSPHIGHTAILILLIGLSSRLSGRFVLWCGILLALSGAIAISSRRTFTDPGDDFANYYYGFLSLQEHGIQELDIFGPDVGLAALYLVLSWFGISSPQALLFFAVFLAALIFMLWLYRYGIKEFTREQAACVVALSFLLFSFFHASQLTRQMLSSCALLFALSEGGASRYVWLAIASTFHIAAIPIFLLCRLLVRFPRVVLVLVPALLWVVFDFDRIVPLLLGIDAAPALAFFGKLEFYAFGEMGFGWGEIYQLAFVSLTITAMLWSYRYVPVRWRNIALPMYALYGITVLFLPLLALRSFLLFVSVIGGYLAAFALYRSPGTIRLLAVALALYKFGLVFKDKSDDPFMMWQSFDWFGLPGYFLF
jgi:hypothetical protein